MSRLDACACLSMTAFFFYAAMLCLAVYVPELQGIQYFTGMAWAIFTTLAVVAGHGAIKNN